MRFPDPIGLKHKISSSVVLSASYQSQGKRQRQEDAVYHDSEDIFVIADGIGGLSHGDIAAQTTVDAAVWAVKIGKQRPSHWKDKKLLVQKIIRSINLTVYNKRIEKEIGVDLGSTLSLLF
ncbi:MAG: hypothetical protein N3A54_07010, partial [Patescibacteria group bacterium]|nr:hypothetical protein [Patescibacteria group bacterium]